MNLESLLNELSQLGGCLVVEAGKLHYRGPRRGLTASLRHAISQQKDELISLLDNETTDTCVWPPPDAADLVLIWNHLGCPEIPLSPGVSIACLETWLFLNWPERFIPDQVAAARHFLWESLPEGETPAENPLLDQWRVTSIPFWRNRLEQATWSGDSAMVKRSRWMLRDILLDPVHQEHRP